MAGDERLMRFLAAQAGIDRLRFLTCGSVDDGKSTLIGRLLYDAGKILEDQLSAQVRKAGGAEDEIDYAMLLDGLADERAQGITIDVAYRFFATEQRRFMVADAPGHEQYTRNMATAAANADLAVLLVDARQGLLAQTRRHAAVAALMGIRHVVLAVNKMDLVDYDHPRFAQIEAGFSRLAAPLGFHSLQAIPLSALRGENVVARSPNMPWYQGPSLLQYLESVDTTGPSEDQPFRMPVQWIDRQEGIRRYAGTIASGQVRPGMTLTVARSGQTATVTGIHTMDGALEHAGAEDAIALELAEQRDIARGDVLTAGAPLAVSDRIEADLIWFAETPLIPGRAYVAKLGTSTVPATVTRIRHRLDIGSFEPVAGADQLSLNDIARVNLSFGTPIALSRYEESRDLGGFILIDRLTNATVAAGMVRAISETAGGAVWHTEQVDKAARAALKGQRPAVLWLTGLSGAGKSTIANRLERKLHALGHHTALLDGDNVRHGLTRDLGFSEADRVENIRRAAEAARLMVEAGLIVLVSFISPYRSDRDAARERFEAGEFLEIFVDTPVDECRRRDPKGLYRRADAGELRNFTGVDAPYEAPLAPELRLLTTEADVDTLADRIIQMLRIRGIIPAG
jgi:bifunctional enzyme CysN/CysC